MGADVEVARIHAAEKVNPCCATSGIAGENNCCTWEIGVPEGFDGRAARSRVVQEKRKGGIKADNGRAERIGRVTKRYAAASKVRDVRAARSGVVQELGGAPKV